MGILKPDSERVNRNQRAFEWVDLPTRNDVAAPKLPVLPDKRVKSGTGFIDIPQVWPEMAVEAWERLWSTPQSTQWSRTDHYSALEQWLTLWVSFKMGDYSGSTLTTLQRIEDKLGLNPKAMLSLRWRYGADAGAHSPLASVKPIRTVRADPRAG